MEDKKEQIVANTPIIEEIAESIILGTLFKEHFKVCLCGKL
jgi:hypothetical protein